MRCSCYLWQKFPSSSVLKVAKKRGIGIKFLSIEIVIERREIPLRTQLEGQGLPLHLNHPTKDLLQYLPVQVATVSISVFTTCKLLHLLYDPRWEEISKELAKQWEFSIRVPMIERLNEEEESHGVSWMDGWMLLFCSDIREFYALNLQEGAFVFRETFLPAEKIIQFLSFECKFPSINLPFAHKSRLQINNRGNKLTSKSQIQAKPPFLQSFAHFLSQGRPGVGQLLGSWFRNPVPVIWDILSP